MHRNAAGVIRVLGAVAIALSLSTFPVPLRADSSNAQVDVVHTSRGELRVRPLYHGSVMLEFDGKVIHVDPGARGTTRAFRRPI
jgi:hypothetical protein